MFTDKGLKIGGIVLTVIGALASVGSELVAKKRQSQEIEDAVKKFIDKNQ